MRVMHSFSYRRFLTNLSAQKIGFFSFILNAVFVGLCYLFLPLERPNYTAIRRRFTHFFPQVDPRRLRAFDGVRIFLQTLFLLFVKVFYFQRSDYHGRGRRQNVKGFFGKIWFALTHWLSAPLRLGSHYYTDRFLNKHSDLHVFLRTRLGSIAFYALCVLAFFVCFFCVTKPFDLQGQILFASILSIVWMLFAKVPTRFGLFMLMVISTVISARYMWWRTTETLNFDSNIGLFISFTLLFAEGYYFIVMILSYFQLSWTLDRKPAPLPEDLSLWPSVDIYVPTYNEPLEVIKPTVYSALKLDWPQDKLRVYILDDGTRDNIRDFAAECGCGYIVRKIHNHAKAGNINHAMTKTDGELISIFDCDHVPVRSFLQMTVGLFLQDEKLALVQTPHYFYSPDPFERNLKLDEHAPPESSLFHDFIQKGNDTWNAAFFCGSCAVIRRKALEQVGGIAVETVTEDAHTSLRLNRLGWGSAFISMRLAAGLSTETLSAHVGQRIRWARGMVQIFRVDCPLLGKGLTFAQRICFITAMVHFFHGAPRLVFLLAPLPFLFFNIYVINASGLAILIYALPHIVFSALTSALTQEGHRQPLLGAIYETVLSWYIFLPTTIALFFPKLGKFNVTAKGGTVDSEYLDWTIAKPYIFMILLNFLGLAFGFWRIWHYGNYELSANLVNIGWVFFNLIVLGASVAVAVETVQQRKFPRVKLNVPVMVRTKENFLIQGNLLNYSQGGVFVALDPKVPTMPFARGDTIDIVFTLNGQSYEFPASVQFADSHRLLGLQVRFTNWQQEQDFVTCTFARADMWFTHRKLATGVGVDLYTSAMRLGHVSMQGYRAMAAHAPKVFRFFIRAIVGMFSWISSFIPRPAVFRKRWYFELALVCALSALAAPFTGRTADAAELKATGSAVAPQTAAAPSVKVNSSKVEPSQSDAAKSEQAAGEALNRKLVERVLEDSKELESGATEAEPVGASAGVRSMTLNQIVPGGSHEGSFRVDGIRTSRSYHFGVRIDELINEGKLRLKYITSPSLIPSKTHFNVYLNGQLQETIPLAEGQNGKQEEVTVTLDPKQFKNQNDLRIEFISQTMSNCMSTGDPQLWAEILGDSTLSVKSQKVRVENDTAVLPEPFVDVQVASKSRIPFVFAASPDTKELKAASILASWFGKYLDWRGAEFPVYYGKEPADEHNVVFITDTKRPDFLKDYPVYGKPAVEMLDAPNSKFAKMLVISAPTSEGLIDAVKAISDAPETVWGQKVLLDKKINTPKRAAYDSPKWLNTKELTRFSDLKQYDTQYTSKGVVPDPIQIDFKLPPDLFVYARSAIPVDLKYRYTRPGSGVPAQMRFLVNGRLVSSYNLDSGKTISSALTKLPLIAELRDMFLVESIPSAELKGYQNQMRFEFPYSWSLDVGNEENCKKSVIIPQQAEIDDNSTVDFRGFYHYTTLPNLQMFFESGFPYTKYADLQDTLVLIPKDAKEGEVATLLNFAGRLGGQTGVVTREIDVANSVADRAQANGKKEGVRELDKDIVIIGSLTPDLVDRYREGENLKEEDLEGFLRAGASKHAQDDSQAESPVGAVFGFESPLKSGRSVLALLANSEAASQSIGEHILAPGDIAQKKNNLCFVKGERVECLKMGADYDVGYLPWYQKIWVFFRDHPVLWVVLTVLSIVLLASLFYIVIRYFVICRGK